MCPFYRGITQAIGAADRDTRSIEDEIDVALGRTIVLENDIEEELGLAPGNKSKPYVALTHISDAAFVTAANLEEKIRSAYDAAI